MVMRMMMLMYTTPSAGANYATDWEAAQRLPTPTLARHLTRQRSAARLRRGVPLKWDGGAAVRREVWPLVWTSSAPCHGGLVRLLAESWDREGTVSFDVWSSVRGAARRANYSQIESLLLGRGESSLSAPWMPSLCCARSTPQTALSSSPLVHPFLPSFSPLSLLSRAVPQIDFCLFPCSYTPTVKAQTLMLHVLYRFPRLYPRQKPACSSSVSPVICVR